MPKQNKRYKWLGFLAMSIFILGGTFFFVSPARAVFFDEDSDNWEDDYYIYIYEDTVWGDTDDLNFNKIIFIHDGATLTLEKGANVKFEKDSRGRETYFSVEGGRLVANGTADEPVSITSDASQHYELIEFKRGFWEDEPNSLPSVLRYTEISGGGYQWDTYCPSCSSFWRDLIAPSAYAKIEGTPAVMFTGGKARFENCTFRNNIYADVGVEYNEQGQGTDTDNYLQVVDSDFEKFADSMALRSQVWCRGPESGCRSKILLQNNWYGDAGGPNFDSNGKSGKGIAGTFLLDGWRSEKMAPEVQRDPVIVIPGIMGSAKVGSKLKIDPILHYYDNLLASLEKNGYKKNSTLFEFPYEWRNSNIISAQDLRDKIKEVKKQTGVEKVDIVAHSMGGLVARYYIEGQNYQNDVDQLITLGTPQKGAPKSYLMWEGGEGFFDPMDKLGKQIFRVEALHAGYTDLQKYIQDKIVSVKELLPDYDYLYDASQGKMRKYYSNYPRNSFLEYINKGSRLEKLAPVDFTSIVGKVAGENTISQFRVTSTQKTGKWEHGMPESFYDNSSNRGIIFNQGDETVPLSSADGISADQRIELNSTHGDLPTTAQCEVVKELTGKTSCQYVSTTKRIKSLLTFGVLSPIDIQVVAPDGKRAGKDFETGEILTEIEGAYYSGSDTADEFLTIPEPVEGEYQILTEGTGNGAYKIKADNISEDENTGETEESVAVISGATSNGQEGTQNLQVEEEHLSADGQDSTPPTIQIKTPENNRTYLNNQIIDIKYILSDNVSATGNIESASYLNNEFQNSGKIDLSLQNLGTHTFLVKAKDESENERQSISNFTISTDINAIALNAKHFYSLKLVKTNLAITTLLDRLGTIRNYFENKTRVEKMNLPAGVKKANLDIIKNQINYQIENLINQIQNKKDLQKSIDPRAAELLIESLNAIRIQ